MVITQKLPLICNYCVMPVILLLLGKILNTYKLYVFTYTVLPINKDLLCFNERIVKSWCCVCRCPSTKMFPLKVSVVGSVTMSLECKKKKKKKKKKTEIWSTKIHYVLSYSCCLLSVKLNWCVGYILYIYWYMQWPIDATGNRQPTREQILLTKQSKMEDSHYGTSSNMWNHLQQNPSAEDMLCIHTLYVHIYTYIHT